MLDQELSSILIENVKISSKMTLTGMTSKRNLNLTLPNLLNNIVMAQEDKKNSISKRSSSKTALERNTQQRLISSSNTLSDGCSFLIIQDATKEPLSRCSSQNVDLSANLNNAS